MELTKIAPPPPIKIYTSRRPVWKVSENLVERNTLQTSRFTSKQLTAKQSIWPRQKQFSFPAFFLFHSFVLFIFASARL